MHPQETPTPEISHAEMVEMIARLKPDREVYAGRQFLKKLLEKRGVEGVLKFHKRAIAALDKQDGLDLYYDFDADEKSVFRRTYLRLWARREFLNTLGWGIPGALSLSAGTLDILGKIAGPTTPEETKPANNNFETAAQHVHQLLPYGEVLIGAALMNEAKEKWVEIKLEQIADALDLLTDQIKAREASQQHGR